MFNDPRVNNWKRRKLTLEVKVASCVVSIHAEKQTRTAAWFHSSPSFSSPVMISASQGIRLLTVNLWLEVKGLVWEKVFVPHVKILTSDTLES